MINIYLIRHSQADNFGKTLEENKVNKLTEYGLSKVKELNIISKIGAVDSVYSSDYVRCISTAEYLFPEKIINIDSRLGERIAGYPDMDITPSEYFEFQMLNTEYKFRGGESLNEVKNRMLETINDIISKKTSEDIAVVTHGAAITFLLSEWCNIKIIDVSKKIRQIKFNDKIIFENNINNLEIFKLTFDKFDIRNIENIK